MSYLFKCGWHHSHHSEPLSQSVSHPMKRSPRRQCRHRNGYPAGIIVPSPKKIILTPRSKIPLCKYPVPACCHGNKVHDSNTSPSPSLPLFYPLSPTPPGPPAPHFLSVSRLTLTLQLPSLSHRSSGAVAFSRPPSLTLSAKWHFTGCFLLLIPPHFASWDSIKAFIKHTPLHKAGAKDTETNSNYF